MRRLFLWVFLLGAFCLADGNAADAPQHWAAYYGSAESDHEFDSFNVLVFDAQAHPHLHPLKTQGKTILGYISMGEAEDFRPYYKQLDKEHVLLKANTQWKGHRIIDIRSPYWKDMLMNQLIPALVQQGYDGIMIDALDGPLELEQSDPDTYGGMREAAMQLLGDIRTSYPTLKIMLNRGFALMPDAAGLVDIELAESIRTEMKNKQYRLTPDKDYEATVKLLKEAQSHNTDMQIFTLDYWNMKDKKGVARIYSDQRAHGFIPYVSVPDLMSVYPEP